MTIEELEEFRGMKNDCDMLEFQIETMYNTYKSPNGRTEPGHGTTPSDPTSEAVARIEKHRRVLERKRNEMLEHLETIDKWVETLPNAQISALIRSYYILGNTWKKTSIIIYGYPCPQRASQRVYRFFKKNTEDS